LEEQAAQELERAIGAGLDSPAALYDIGMIRFHEEGWKAQFGIFTLRC
jgi:hypothetical protein